MEQAIQVSTFEASIRDGSDSKYVSTYKKCIDNSNRYECFLRKVYYNWVYLVIAEITSKGKKTIHTTHRIYYGHKVDWQNTGVEEFYTENDANGETHVLATREDAIEMLKGFYEAFIVLKRKK